MDIRVCLDTENPKEYQVLFIKLCTFAAIFSSSFYLSL